MAVDMDYIEVKRSINLGSLFLGILIGAVAGGTAALLLAPKSGPETRTFLRDKAMETQQMLQNRVKDVTERASRAGQCLTSGIGTTTSAVGEQK